MKIVVLDGFTLNPGDLSWSGIEQFGLLTLYDRTLPSQVLERCGDAEIVLTNKVVLDAPVLKSLSGTLRYVGVLATGYNVVDVAVARELGIVVTNIPAYSTDSVVQCVFAHLLNITNSVSHYANQIGLEQSWVKSRDFCYVDTPLWELSGKLFGIVGLGRIGSAVARVAHAFGMMVLAYTGKPQSALPSYINKVSKEELFRQSDVLSLHCPLSDDTRHIVSCDTLRLMKPTAILINTGRGPLVDEDAVAEALRQNRLGAFAADVLSQEPPLAGNPLLSAPRAYLTPHIAWATVEARQRLMQICENNIQAFVAGHPINVVSVNA